MARNTQPPAEGEPVVPTGDEPKPPGITTEEPAADELSVAELKEQAAARGVDPGDIDGSGQDGRVVKADLVEVVTEIPQPPTGRPPLIQVAEGAATHLIATED